MPKATHPIEGELPLPQAAADLLAHVVHSVPALISYIDRDERFVFANEAHRRWFDIEPRTMVGKLVSAVLDPESYLRARAALLQSLSGQDASYEGEMFSAPRRRYVHGSFTPDLDKFGRLRGVLTVFTDITERHALEEQLRESEQRFSQAFHHAAVGMALILPNGRYQQVNTALCDMLGYSESEMRAFNWRDLTHPDDLPLSEALAGQLTSGRRDAFQTEKRYIHRDGHVVHVLLSVAQIRSESGKTNYAVSQVQDITKRKQYEEALFRERQLAEVTLNSIGDAVITTDISLNVTSLNPIAEAMTGWSNADAKGSPLDDVFRLRDINNRQPLDNPLRQAMRRNAIVDFSGRAILLHRNGFETPIENSAALIHDHAGNVTGGVLVCHDISENRTLALKMIQLAQHDTLTGLPNRSLLYARIEQAAAMATQRHRQCALLYLDLDHFRRINDTLGHGVGDQVLQAVAQQIRATLRDSEDMAFRYSGDEFVVLLPRVDDADEAAGYAQRLLDACSQTHVAHLPPLDIRASIGISLFPRDATEPDALVRTADAAMYEVKTQGRHGYCFYAPEMSQRTVASQRIENVLRHALAHGELSLQYQPKVDARLGHIVGAEALLRLQVDGKDLFVPDQFIPVAEDTGLIVSIGTWVLREACQQARRWQRDGRPIPVSVNVSPLQFQYAGFYERLDSIINETGLDPNLLELELTERTMMSGGDGTIRLLRRIRQRGVRLSLDDFGTGYSSLSYLKHFPVDALKIDRAFVRDITQDAETAAITSAIIAMARSLNKDVIAEGVETEVQSAFLREAGCSQMQGFLFGAPMPAALLEERLTLQASATAST
ncbi:sensor domain-containing protein [Dyella acidiphila]|uniref:EAL domain-containing protein n=1 Tax=Dyella acidiphila TaxID=2775866 RepID=A0ABR9GG77_9GAMM|nr:GGDEF and EAL domain-containing protein [Dyella acidiphila]MBE1162984.1 EAL domain-containing protein [Dyella acidiphila]